MGLLAGVGFIVVVFLIAQLASEQQGSTALPQPPPELVAPGPEKTPVAEDPTTKAPTLAKDPKPTEPEPEPEIKPEPKPEKSAEPEAADTPEVKPTPPPADPVGLKAPPKKSVSYTVKVVSIPAGAEVVINGMRQRTPGTIDVLKGVNSAYITFPDGSSKSCSVDIGANTNQLAFRQSGGTISCP